MSRRIASLAAVVALSGAPAVLSVCMAFCLPAVPSAAAAEPAMDHAAHATTPVTASEHAHHAAPVPAAHAAHAASPAASGAHVTASCGTCCDDTRAVTTPGVTADRTAALAVATAPVVASVLAVPTDTVTRGVAFPAMAGPPPPTRAPLVLRI